MLPTLKKISVNHYSLYKQQPSFEYEFKEGINAIIGVNGIGKTTFVEIILYCLLGFKREYRFKKYKRKTTLEINKENPEFFSSRLDISYAENSKASVSLEYLVGEDAFEVHRSLYEDKIVSFKLNTTTYDNVDESFYEKLLLESTGFSSFKSLQTIIRNFLFFDEMRVNVAWEEDNQDEILRILFFDEELLNKFNILEQKIIELDTAAKHLSEDRRIFRQKLDELLAERAQLKKNGDESEEEQLFLLIEKKNNLELEKGEIISLLGDLANQYKKEDQELNKLVGNKNRTAQQIEQLETEIAQLEVKLYSSIYDTLPDFYLSLERRLLNDGTCLVCNNKHRHLVKHTKEYKEKGICLVCSSPLNEAVEVDPGIIEQMNKLSEKKDQLKIILSNQLSQLNIKNGSVKDINNAVMKYNEKIEQINGDLINIETILAEKAGTQKNDTFSEIVKGREKKILELTQNINETNKMKRIETKEMQDLHNQFVQLVTSLNKNLSSYFNKYASTFIGLKCELTVKNINLHNQNIPHVIYLPKIDGVDRQNIWSVSESQRFFLDQAFRMAIIDYLHDNIEGFQTFFITETPEGSLDIAYEDQVAKMFILFSESKNNIIFTSNLNSSRFLQKLFKDMGDHEKGARTLNLLSKGRLTAVHNEHKPIINEILNQIFGEGVL